MSASVRVVARFRPQNSSEIQRGLPSCIEVQDERNVAFVNDKDRQIFAFDRVFNENSSQQEVFSYAAEPVINDVLNGYNGTVFAYGQTSSGKTHTMQGYPIDDPVKMGIIPRMVKTLFAGVAQADPNTEFIVKVSFVEIYMERIRDLFDPSKENLAVKEEKGKGIYIAGVTEISVASEEEVLQCMAQGTKNRSVTCTNMNEGSSRSHSIFVTTIVQHNTLDGGTKTGKLYLVDLAGSEKVGKTGAEGQVLEEAKMINKSLSALGNVINALTEAKCTHIPYRESKLTRILQESLGGNSRTCLIICASPSMYNEAETLGTLRFGLRAKSIKNKPKVNKERSVQELLLALAAAEKVCEDQKKAIMELQREVLLLRGGGAIPMSLKSGQLLPEPVSASFEGVADIHEELRSKVESFEEQLRGEREVVVHSQAAVKKLLQENEELKQEMEQLKAEHDTDWKGVREHIQHLHGLFKDTTTVGATDEHRGDRKAIEHHVSELLLSVEGIRSKDAELQDQLRTEREKLAMLSADHHQVKEILRLANDAYAKLHLRNQEQEQVRPQLTALKEEVSSGWLVISTLGKQTIRLCKHLYDCHLKLKELGATPAVAMETVVAEIQAIYREGTTAAVAGFKGGHTGENLLAQRTRLVKTIRGGSLVAH